MNKLHQFFEYAYFILAILFIIEGILKWSSEREKAYFFFGFSILALFMYFFKRKFRKRIASRNTNQKK